MLEKPWRSRGFSWEKEKEVWSWRVGAEIHYFRSVMKECQVALAIDF